MKTTLMIMLLAVAAMVPALILPTAAGAAPRDRYERYDRYERRDRPQRRSYYRSNRYRYNEYTDRANNLDPSREYGGYPDWARAALAPKYDGGNRR